MTKVCLVRHGETDWNRAGKIQGREDIPLNDTGKKQARRCGEYLKNGQWNILVSSPLKRARETAEIIGGIIGIKNIQLVEAFQERDYGLASGLTKKEREFRFPSGNVPGWENDVTLQKRVMGGLEKLVRQYPEKNVLIVAHGGVIRTVLSKIKGCEKVAETPGQLHNACINIVNYEDGRWNIRACNIVSHLQ